MSVKTKKMTAKQQKYFGKKKVKKGNTEEKTVKESIDKIHLGNFIGNMSKGDFAEANKFLELVIREKTRNLIKKYTS